MANALDFASLAGNQVHILFIQVKQYASALENNPSEDAIGDLCVGVECALGDTNGLLNLISKMDGINIEKYVNAICELRKQLHILQSGLIAKISHTEISSKEKISQLHEKLILIGQNEKKNESGDRCGFNGSFKTGNQTHAVFRKGL